MNWGSRIVAEFKPGSSATCKPRLPELTAQLLDQQKEEWPLLSQGYAAFEQRQTKTLTDPNDAASCILIQYNPGRIRSTAAQVDKASIESRPCFLCPDNLPPEEKGIAYGPDLVIACNPFPVLDRHLSVIDRQHVPQRIDGRHLDSLLTLSADLGEEYITLYNGPECGASAPDHFHLQACARKGLPIERDFERARNTSGPENYSKISKAVAISTMAGWRRTVVVFNGVDRETIVFRMLAVVAALGRVTGKTDEPMVNIVAVFHSGVWTVFLFPRARHRPESYFKEGNEKMIVSPGAIDMAGVIVTPRLEDFERMTAIEVTKVFSEVSLDWAATHGALASVLD